MPITVEMRVQGSCGTLNAGIVNDETTIKDISDRIREFILHNFPDSAEAQMLNNGKEIVLVAYNTSLPKEKKIAEIMKEHHIHSIDDNFFYKTHYLFLNEKK